MIYGTLRVTTPDGQVREYPMESTDSVLGRSQGVGITVDHVSVSRRHAALRIENGRLLLQDLGSASGTFVGGQRIEPQQQHSVAPGQMIRFGDCEAMFIAAQAEPEPEPMPSPVTEAEPPAAVAPVAATPQAPSQPATSVADPNATVLEQPAAPATAAGPAATPAAPEPATPATPATTAPASGPQTPTAAVPPSAPAVAPPPAPPRMPRQQERPATIALTLASPTAPVAAGATATATVVVQNRGTVVDQVAISVPELDPSWVQVRRTSLSLVPGARDEVTIVLKPPKHSSATAGEHQFAVSAASSEQGNEVRVLGKFTILPFEQFEISVRQSGGKSAVTLRNLGNAPVTRTVVPADDDDALRYTVDTEEVELGPGEEKVVQLQVKPRRRNPFGANKFYRYRVEARSKSPGPQTVQAPGSYAYKAPLRHWRYMLVGALLAALVGGGYWAWRADKIPFLGGSDDDTGPTPTVSVTATVEDTPTATDTPGAAETPTITVNGTVTIINSPADSRLRVRVSPDPAADQVDATLRLGDGEVATVLEGPTDNGGARWWKIRTAGGVEGWAAEMLLGATGSAVEVGPWMEPAE